MVALETPNAQHQRRRTAPSADAVVGRHVAKRPGNNRLNPYSPCRPRKPHNSSTAAIVAPMTPRTFPANATNSAVSVPFKPGGPANIELVPAKAEYAPITKKEVLRHNERPDKRAPARWT